MPLKALLFDVDGTLADTEEIHRQAFNGAFARHGYDWDWNPSLYRDLLTVTGGKERLGHFIRTLGLAPARESALLAEVPDLHRTKTALFEHLISNGAVTLRPGVLRILRESSDRGLRLGIATTTTPANVDALLQATVGEDVQFHTIIAGDMVPQKKPAPDAYFEALRRLRLSADEAVAFEDSENGLRAARAAGLPTIVTHCQWTREHSFEGAHLVLPHLGDENHPLQKEEHSSEWPWLTLADIEQSLRQVA
jgi:HAD superfamily hydrolase (TIGR01509 family)